MQKHSAPQKQRLGRAEKAEENLQNSFAPTVDTPKFVILEGLLNLWQLFKFPVAFTLKL